MLAVNDYKLYDLSVNSTGLAQLSKTPLTTSYFSFEILQNADLTGVQSPYLFNDSFLSFHSSVQNNFVFIT